MPTKSKSNTAAKKQLSSNNYMIVIVLVSLLTVGISVLVSKTLISSISRDGKVKSESDKANSQLVANLDAAPKLVNQFNSLAPSTTTLIKHSLPTTTDFPGLISTLESAADNAGMIFSSISPDTTTSSDNSAPVSAPSENPDPTSTPMPQEYLVDAQISGNYVSISKMFLNIEQSARPIRITSIKLSGSGPILTGNLTLTTYYEDKAVLPFSTEYVK